MFFLMNLCVSITGIAATVTPLFLFSNASQLALCTKHQYEKYISNPNKSITFSHSKLSVASIFDSAFQSSSTRKRSIFFIYKLFFFLLSIFLISLPNQVLKELLGWLWVMEKSVVFDFFLLFFHYFFLNTFHVLHLLDYCIY